MRANRLMAMLLVSFVVGSGAAVAAGPVQKTVEALNVDKAQLNGQQVQFKGKVVKVNNNIMGKNFLHVQDGTGAAGTNDVTVTSAQTAQVGDVVTVVGKVVTNRDFGAGYTYPLIIEEATLAAAK
jgi:hypothetical protein